MITFKPLQLIDEHINLLYTWLCKPHVVEHWDPAPKDLEQIQKKYRKKIESDTQLPYLICLDDKPIGYIQSYYAPAIGDGWWEDQPEGTWGMDIFIGEEDSLGKGYGSESLKLFVIKIFEEHGAKKIIIDPDPENKRAIRAYEKAGFAKKGIADTPDGRVLLMEIER